MTEPVDHNVVGLRRAKRGATSIDLLPVLLALAVLAGPLYFLFFTSMHW